MNPLARLSKPKRALVLLAAFAAIAAADLICIQLFGKAPWVLDYLTIIGVFAGAAFVIFVPTLLLADRLVRMVPRSYRSWVWLTLAIVFATVVLVAVIMLLRAESLAGLGSFPASEQPYAAQHERRPNQHPHRQWLTQQQPR
jgi:hypothetical protein